VNDTVDSLSQKLDHAVYHHGDLDSIRLWTEAMQEQARLDPGNSELRERANFYRAMWLNSDGETAEADSIFNDMLARVDSAAHPYLYNRVSWQADNSPVRDAGAYARIAGRLEYFKSAGDDFFAGAMYTDLGNLLKKVRDPEGALAAYRSADSLYRLCGATDIAVFNRVNIASALTVMRDTVSAVSLLREMSCDSCVKARGDVERIVLEDLYLFAHDTTALFRLYDMQKDRPEAITLLGMAEQSMNRGDYARAKELSELALDTAIEDGDPDRMALAVYAMSDASAAAGDTAAAYVCLKDAVDLTDQIAIANEPDEISALETMRGIESMRLEAEMAKSKATLRYACAAFVLFLLLVVAAWAISSRMQRLKTQRLEAMRERDSMSRRLIATQVARTESELLISAVGKEIDGMADEGRLSAGDTQRIANAIRTHAVKQGDRETFIETFGSMHPDFAQRLREINGAFTESDIRLASYIAMGMDTKHIADTIGVRPESVKQARWRLRSKIGLEKGTSLEDALRALLD